MKNIKKFVLIFVLLIMLSGCSITRIDNNSFDEIMDKVLDLKINTYNKIGSGYKYYAPRGVVRTNLKEYNDILKRDNLSYYLYVDVVGHYYNTNEEYIRENNTFYSKEITKNGKKGFIDINKKDNKLYIKMFYNYARIESCVEEKDLKKTILDMSYILTSIKFNDSLLTKLYEAGDLSSKDEAYKLFKNKDKEGNFLEYIKEFDKYDESLDKKEETIITTTTKQTTTTKKEEEKPTTTSADETTTTTTTAANKQ